MNVPQLYGIGDYYNGKNIVGFIPYKSGMSINLSAADNIWWKGYRNCEYHHQFQSYWEIKHGYILNKSTNEFTGGIIGFNKIVLNEKGILEGLDYSERTFEYRCKWFIKNLHVVTTKNIVNLNVKCLSGADLHNINQLKREYDLLDKLNVSEMDTLLKDTITEHIEYFNKL